MKTYLRTFDEEMAVAWRRDFAEESSVSIEVGDILQNKAHAILSPANCFGFMDGGIDLAYSHFFGWELEQRVKAKINSEFAGELPIGCALVVPTENTGIPFLICAPTMRVPSKIAGTVNVFLAFRAALLAIRRHNATAKVQIDSILAPAFGAGIGMVPPSIVARQMSAAYREIERGETAWRSTARGVLARHYELIEG